ncbi:MAG: site-2 protease family protein [Candidatus Saccharibacteria bacterium]
MILTNKVFVVVITFAIVIISVIIHEVMHGFVAKKLGDDTAEQEGRLTLNPIAHIDPFMTLALPILLAATGQPIFGAAKPVPVLRHRLKWDEFGMAIVAIAGPLSNLLLAVVGGLMVRFAGINDAYWTTWWVYFVSINIGFFIFNMIPLPPLDGSRVLYAFAPESMQRFMDKIEPFGIFIVLGLVVFGLPIIGPIISNIYQTLINLVLV